jgi:2-furoyl-CoA dehydrogenase FAD binding subunit
MKAPPFAYVRPATLDDVLAELAGGDAKVLAGGQSLVPVLAMRLGRPATLVDINSVAELHGFEAVAGALRIGAAVAQRTVERAAQTRAVPLIGMALPFVGHRELRSRGTVVGSLAHADPAAELPAVASCLDATVEVTGPAGRRRIPAGEFFAGAMTTAAGPEDIVVAVECVATMVRVDHGGTVAQARLTGFGISDRPVTRDVTHLVGDQDLREPMAELAAEVVDTAGDGHGSTGYRRRLFAVLAARELAKALTRGRESRDANVPVV